MVAVDAAFVETGRGLDGWPDPHPDRMPLDEEYSRVTNPQRWEILAARAEAWFKALTEAGLAEIETEAAVDWQEPPRIAVSHTLRAVPLAPGAIPLTVAMTRFDEDDWPAVVLGAGDPAAVLDVVPDCACDACDSGSQDVLDVLDEYILCVVTGSYRKLWRGRREITVYSEDDMGWSGFDRRRVNFRRFIGGRFTVAPTMFTDDYYPLQPIEYQSKPKWLQALRRAIADKSDNGHNHRKQRKKIEKILARPKRWHQIHGSPWLDSNPTAVSEDPGFGMRELKRPT